MTKDAPKATAKKTISIPQELADAAEGEAKRQRRNFSSYIQSLIARDLEREAAAAGQSAA